MNICGYYTSNSLPSQGSFNSIELTCFSLFFPARVTGIVSFDVHFLPPNSIRHRDLPEGFYILRWKENGRAEADFGRYNVNTVLSRIYTLFSRSGIPIAKKHQEIMNMVDE
ncbi:hypothetical protein Csa_013557 [Cucumis sativus]|uniref:Uncharacterized protein n=1 Tax=Cucumis sativus TaxID=3659 RepID=A0A0A0LRV8_CUCSA|nr:hypothetical protein Csa_013557 [Cucumis sativus]